MTVEASRTTDSGIEVERIYKARDNPTDLEARLGDPGQPPFTRGPYPNMYRERLWTMRQYAGYGSASDTNARFRYLLGQGQTALSVAFDLPTQLGFDSTTTEALPEVGRVGVAIDTADDMTELFRDLPLDQLSVNFTINATAPIILAFYIIAAERQGVDPAQLSGTLQNDILKEFVARKTYIYPPEPSMRLVGDIVEYCTTELPRFNPISITGYHAREAGCNAIQELALTMSSAIAYSTLLTERGLRFDDFAPRLSFHFATTLELFEEVAKLRASRRIWANIARDRFGASNPDSMRLRFFSGCSGSTLTAQQPLNNVVRSTVQCLGAVLGGAQSIHVMGYDEAMAIPSTDAVTLALRTQQIVAHETGVADTVDPFAGSFFVEALTDEVEQRALELVKVIDDSGGAVAAIEAGIPQRWIAENAFRIETAMADGSKVKVGVNAYVSEGDEDELELFEVDEGGRDSQVARLRQHLERRGDSASAALVALAAGSRSDENIMPLLLDAARAGATLGEMSDIFQRAWGTYKEPALW
ncbi:MAG: methylmalonyl-CoA mutase [Actinobacteria bacterium]|nr:methylmalonyl-CoA mutase [Actinomycetota bacterium]